MSMKIILKDDKSLDTPAKETGRKMSKKEMKLSRKLSKELLKDIEANRCKGFMHEKLENIVLFNDTSKEYATVKGRLSKRRIAKLGNDFKGSSVLINSGVGNYRKISFPTYKALCRIRYMIIEMKVFIIEDGEEDGEAVYEEEYKISSLNQLFNFLRKREGLLVGLQKYHTGVGWYSVSYTEETAKILYKQKTARKMDLEKFLSKYDLY